MDLKWFFIICIAAFLVITLRSLMIQKKAGRTAGAKHRNIGFWIAAFGAFVLFSISAVKSAMADYNYSSAGRMVVYGDETREIIKKYKNGDHSVDIDRSNRAEEDEEYFSITSIADISDSSKRLFSISLSSLKELPDDCVQIKPMGVKASSSLKKYPPQMLIDGDTSTGWQAAVDSPEKYNSGEEEQEWLQFGFDSEQHIDYIVIYNGTPDSEERFYKNGRAHEIRLADISSETGDEENHQWTDPVELNDGMDILILECHGLNVKDLLLNIDSMYIGKKYKELCIADILFYSAE